MIWTLAAVSTSGVGVEIGSYENSIYDVLVKKIKPKDAIQKTKLDFLDVIPSSAQLVGAEIELVSEMSREFMLKDGLEALKKSMNTLLLIASSLGLLTLNVLTASILSLFQYNVNIMH